MLKGSLQFVALGLGRVALVRRWCLAGVLGFTGIVKVLNTSGGYWVSCGVAGIG